MMPGIRIPRDLGFPVGAMLHAPGLSITSSQASLVCLARKTVVLGLGITGRCGGDSRTITDRGEGVGAQPLAAGCY